MSAHSKIEAVVTVMDPYAKPKERRIGAQRPKVRHVAHSTEPRTRRERKAEKEGVAAQRRAIKKAARRHLKQQLLEELEQNIPRVVRRVGDSL